MGKPKARGHGEGTIFQRSDGRWVGAVSLGPGRKKKQFYGKTKREVQEKVKQAFRELEQGVAIEKPHRH